MFETIRAKHAARPDKRSAQRVVHVLYLCALVLYVVWFGLSVTNVGKASALQGPASFFNAAIKGYLVFFLFCIFLLDAFLNGISARKLIFGVLAIILLQNVLSNIYTSETQKCVFQFFVWILLAYPRHLESRRALTVVWVTGAVFAGVVIALSVIGIVPNAEIKKSSAIAANSFGFRGLSVESLFLCSLIMTWVYCKSRSWNWLRASIAVVLMGAVFLVTGSRVNMALGIFQVIVTCLLSQGAKWAWVRGVLARALGKLGTWILPVFALLCLLLAILLSWTDTAPLKVVNKIMGGGIESGAAFFGEYGYPLFCERIERLSHLDNTFIYVVMSCGLVCLVCLVVLYWKFARFVERQPDPHMSLLIVLVAAHMLFDSTMFLPVYNPVLIAIGAFIAMGPRLPATEKSGANKRPGI